jgi:RNA polymerase sigma-70 factor (ECF subfamily)
MESAQERNSVGVDAESFREFYDTALPVVYGYFFRRCGGRVETVEELTQETFVAVVRAIQQGNDIEAPLPWVVAVARRRLVDHYRKERSHRRRLEALRARTDPPSAMPALTTAVEARIVGALQRLSPAHRTVLVLRYVDGLPVREVAEFIGRSERATESLLVRARAALARAYEEAEHA